MPCTSFIKPTQRQVSRLSERSGDPLPGAADCVSLSRHWDMALANPGYPQGTQSAEAPGKGRRIEALLS